jgi:CHAT domain-containing protein
MAAERVLEAWRAGDGAVLRSVAGMELDPFRVADALMILHARAVARDGESPSSAALDAAAALADLVAKRPKNAALPGLVSIWRTFTPDRLAAEVQLSQDVSGIERHLHRGNWAPAVAAARGEKRLGAGPLPTSSVSAVLLLDLTAYGLEHTRRPREALRLYLDAACTAETIGWRARELLDRFNAAVLVSQVGSPGQAAESLEAVALAWETLDEKADAAIARLNGADHLRRIGATKRAIETYVRARRGFIESGRAEQAAGTSMNLGNLLLSSGRATEALELQLEAFRELEALRKTGLAGQALINVGNCFNKLRDYDNAILQSRRAREMHKALGDRRHELYAATNLAHAFFLSNRTKEALETYREVRALTPERDRIGTVRARFWVARTQFSFGARPETVDVLEHLIPALERQGDESEALEARYLLGRARGWQGDYRTAIELLQGVERDQERRGDRHQVAAVRLVLAGLLSSVGSKEESIALFQGAADVFREERRPDNLVSALVGIGTAYRDLGDASMAERVFRDVVALHERAPRDFSPSGLESIAFAWQQLGQRARALPIRSEQLDRALARGDTHHAAELRLLLAHDYCALGEHQEEIEALEQARRELEELGERQGLAFAFGHLAATHRWHGDLARSLVAARKSIELRVRFGAGLSDSEVLNFRRKDRQASDTGVLAAGAWALAEPERATEAAAEAWWFAEAGRGLLLVDELTRLPGLLESRHASALAKEHRGARERVDDRRHQLLQAVSAGADPRVVARSRKELDEAYQALEKVIARFQREERWLASVALPLPPDRMSFQELLPPDTAFLLYQLTEEDAWAVLLKRTGPLLVSLGAASSLVSAVQSYLGLVPRRVPEELEEAQRLYERLLRPVEEHLGGVRRILVAPDGILAYLPFEVLADHRQRAIERWEFAYVPSGTAYAALLHQASSAAPGAGLVALGDPLYPGSETVAPLLPSLRGLGSVPWPRLLGSGEEVRAIGELFPEEQRTVLLGEGATRAALQEALERVKGRLRAVHLACHGVVDPRRPRLSGLVLAQGEMLTLDDLLTVTRLPADLTVLSGCETARGAIESAEGIVGLARGAFLAGCPRVIASTWKVQDQSTRELMVSFYRKFLREEIAPASALRAAKLELLHRGGDCAHPAEWAPLVLWGVPD